MTGDQPPKPYGAGRPGADGTAERPGAEEPAPPATVPPVAGLRQPTARRATVVGGGIAGLAAAWELSTRGWEVTVIEAGPQLGGKLRRAVVAGTTVDVGPDSFITRRPEALALCGELGIDGQLLHPAVTGAAVWARHRLRRLPDGLVVGVPTRLGPLARSGILGPIEVLRSAFDLCRASPAGSSERDAADVHDGETEQDWSVAELVGPRLGRAVVDRLVDPLVGGIHAGPTASMSARAVFPELVRAAARGGSLMRALRPPSASATRRPPDDVSPSSPPPLPLFASPPGGMAALVDAVAAGLRRRGVTLATQTPCTGLEAPTNAGDPWTVGTPAGRWEADGLVLAVPTSAAAALLAGARQARLARLLGALEWADVVLVTLAFAPRGPAGRFRRGEGTGYLVPAQQGLLTTGCTWLSAKWPALYGDGPVLVRLSAGRAGDRRALELDDRTLVRRLLAELRAVTGDVDDPIDAVVTRWPEAFPQYRVGHPTWVRAVTTAVDTLPGLALAGAAYAGVGVPACIGTGRHAAERLDLRVPTPPVHRSAR